MQFKSTAVLHYVEGVSELLRRCIQQQGIGADFRSDTTLRSHAAKSTSVKRVDLCKRGWKNTREMRFLHIKGCAKRVYICKNQTFWNKQNFDENIAWVMQVTQWMELGQERVHSCTNRRATCMQGKRLFYPFLAFPWLKRTSVILQANRWAPLEELALHQSLFSKVRSVLYHRTQFSPYRYWRENNHTMHT